MTTMEWKTLSSETILQDDWISLRADVCEMPNGNLVEPYYVLDYPAWVNAIALTDDNQVILVKQYRHGVKQTALELPCGGVEPEDKSPQEAIKRELLEETGYKFNSYEELGAVSPNSANHSNLTYCFLAKGVASIENQNLDSNEQIETKLVPFDDFIEMAKSGEFNQALHVSAIFYLLCRLGKI